MTISARYIFTITCDTCEKQIEHEADVPSVDPTPIDWMSAVPPGEATMKQFCSSKCFSKYKPNKPWRDDA